jgi:hypothetical protein
MNDTEFLKWLVERLTLVYGESGNMDFVRKLERIIENMELRHWDMDGPS